MTMYVKYSHMSQSAQQTDPEEGLHRAADMMRELSNGN